MRRRFRRNKSDGPADPDAPEPSTEGAASFDALLADTLAEPVEPVEPAESDPAEPVHGVAPVGGEAAESVSDRPPDFWSLHDRARAEAELIALPTSIPVLVVGPLGAARPVIHAARRAAGSELVPVFVLTPDRSQIDDRDGWTLVGQPSDLVAVLDDERTPPPLLVLDVPHELPAFVGPLVARLRQSGIELVRYVLDDDPDDEDVATWCGELGQPSVLDLAAPIEPRRVLELFDRGDPVVSVAGHELGPALLTALRVEVLQG